jgi:hypothetical protein
MSVIAVVIGCDWPGCTNNVQFGPSWQFGLEDFGWEAREAWHAGGWHLCPYHKRFPSNDLLHAIAEEVSSKIDHNRIRQRDA